MTYTAYETGVMRSDGAWIPNEPDNRDWIEYQQWLAEGNVPLQQNTNSSKPVVVEVQMTV